MLFIQAIELTANYYTKTYCTTLANVAMQNCWTMQQRAEGAKGSYREEKYNKRADAFAHEAVQWFANAKCATH